MKYLIHLKEAFVKEHYLAPRLPSALLEETCRNLAGVTVEKTGPFVLAVDLTEGTALEDLARAALEALMEAFGLTMEEAASCLSIEETGKTGGKEETDQGGKALQVLEEIRGLKGAGDFIGLCEEIHAAAPLLLKRGQQSALAARSYLMSCDSDEGLSVALHLLAALLREEGLFRALRVVERKVPLSGLMQVSMGPDSARNILGQNQTEDVLEAFSSALVQARDVIVELDISEWTDRIEAPEFRTFLEALQDNTENVIYVFRVPYMEKDILERIGTVLADIMMIRQVVFVPHSMADLEEMLVSELEEAGFAADEEALALFRQRIAEEKADGRFYGIRTVSKLFDEMVYQRICRAAERGEDLSETPVPIGAADLEGFVRSRRWNQTPDQIMEGLCGFEDICRQLREAVEDISRQVEETGRAGSMHMCFEGEPGTGRSTAASLLAAMLREKGLLSDGLLFEHRAEDMVSSRRGLSVPAVMKVCRDAFGSVLYIDEIGALEEKRAEEKKAGPAKEEELERQRRQALRALVSQMEDHGQELVVVLAGRKESLERMLEAYPRLKRAVGYTIRFGGYSRETMAEIFRTHIREGGLEEGPGLWEEVRSYFSHLDEKLLKASDFSNARYVQNIFNQAQARALMRMQLNGDPGETGRVLEVSDFRYATRERREVLVEKPRKASRYGFGI